MASDVSINLKLLTASFDQGMGKVQKQLKSSNQILNSFAGNIAAIGFSKFLGGITRAAGAVVQFGQDSIQAAVDAEETESKFEAVFNNIGDAANDMAKELQKSYGLGVTESKALLSATGDLLTGFEFTQTEALGLSADVQKLAVDLASFTNFSGGAKGASEAITKALLGEREGVKALGISIQEKDVQEQVAINRAAGLTFVTERQAKAQATLDLAFKQSKNSLGDYARTSTSAANLQRLLGVKITDFSEALGKKLLPAYRAIIGAMIDFIDSIDLEFFGGVVKTISENVDNIKALGAGLLFAASAWGTYTIAVNATTIATGLATKATKAFNLAMKLTPWGLAIIAATTFGAIVYKALNTDETKTSDNIEELQQELEFANNNVIRMHKEMTDSGKTTSVFLDKAIARAQLLTDKINKLKTAKKGAGAIDGADSNKTEEELAKEEAIRESARQIALEAERVHQANLQVVKDEGALNAQMAETEMLAVSDENKFARQEQELLDLQALESQKLELAIQADLKKAQLETDVKKKAIAVDKAEKKAEISRAILHNKQQSDLQKQQDTRTKATTIAMNQFKAQQRQLDNDSLAKGFQLGAALAKDGSKEQFIINKVGALAQIAVNDGLARSGAFAQTAAIPYPANLAALAQMQASISLNTGLATAIVAAQSIKGFANGGFVPGTSFSGDKLRIGVNSGEFIANDEQQKNIIAIANGEGGGGNNDAILELAAAIRANPTVVTINGEAVFEAVREEVESGKQLSRN